MGTVDDGVDRPAKTWRPSAHVNSSARAPDGEVATVRVLDSRLKAGS